MESLSKQRDRLPDTRAPDAAVGRLGSQFDLSSPVAAEDSQQIRLSQAQAIVALAAAALASDGAVEAGHLAELAALVDALLADAALASAQLTAYTRSSAL